MMLSPRHSPKLAVGPRITGFAAALLVALTVAAADPCAAATSPATSAVPATATTARTTRHAHAPESPAPTAAAAAAAATNADTYGGERLSHGRFTALTVYRPATTPKSVVLFLSGDEGWRLQSAEMAKALVAEGALVVGIDTPQLIADFETDGGDCVFPDGDLENLSHWVQAYYHLPTYQPPLLVGHESGATLAYAVLAQAPKDTFGGALSLSFCTSLAMHKPLCPGSGLESRARADGRGTEFLPSQTLSAPWTALQGEIDQVCDARTTQRFVAQVPRGTLAWLPQVGHGDTQPSRWLTQFRQRYAELAAADSAKAPPPPPAALGALPVVEVPAKNGGADSQTFAILMSGDGGWAGLDQEVAGALSARGIPVVGLDSLRYYWTPRNPDGVTVDLDRLIRYYLAHWNKQRVLLLGYSQGADVMPFILTRLPAATRPHVALGGMMGLSEHAAFEFHVSNWVGNVDSGPATLPELRKVTDIPLLCIYGADEDDTICPQLDTAQVRVVKMPGGHHFGGDYQRLAEEILHAARP